MKSIVFITSSLDVGGVEKSLVRLVNKIPKDKYKITILLMDKKGKLLKEVDKNIIIEQIAGINDKTKNKVFNLIKKFKIISAIKLLINHRKCLKAKSVYNSYINYSKLLPIVENNYDIAISYFNPTTFPVVYTINNIKATKKIMWIHSDVTTYEDIFDFEEIYKKYDYIVNASKEGKEKFKSKFPSIKDNVKSIYNILDCDNLMKMCEIGQGFDESDYIKILTVGRLSEEKGQQLIPKIINELGEYKNKIKWYCIGDGPLRETLEQCGQKLIENKTLILLGNMTNPYRYLKECDIYVQPSKNECYCTAVTEAKYFARPIIVTDVNGMREQITDGFNGTITDLSVSSIKNAILDLIKNKTKREFFESNLKSFNYKEKEILNDFIELIN